MPYIIQLTKFIAQAQKHDLHTRGYEKNYKDFEIKISFGQAIKARVPWIAFLAGGQKVSDGIYPVFLYYANYSLLILAYGVSEMNTPKLSWGLKYSSKIESVIDVKKQSYRYGKSFVYKKYHLDVTRNNYGLDEIEIDRDLDNILYEYKMVLSGYQIINESEYIFKEPEIDIKQEVGKEGGRRVVTSLSAERNRSLREKALKYHGAKCIVCGFDFKEAYGEEYGENFIEIHHVQPLSENGIYNERLTDYKLDLVPVCANCHRMIHRKRKEVLSIEKLRSILSQKYLHN